MVVMDRELHKQQAAALGTVVRRKRASDNLYYAPPGLCYCPEEPSCMELVSLEALAGNELVRCNAGHEFDPVAARHEELQRQYEGGSGGWTHAGLSPTDQGRIGEMLMREIGHIGEFGRFVWEPDHYNSPLDFVTDLGYGGDFKTLNKLNRNQAYILGKIKECLAKRAMARSMKLKKYLVGVLVVLDYENKTADIYVRLMRDLKKKRHICRWDKSVRWLFREGVPFEHIYKQVTGQMDAVDMPF